MNDIFETPILFLVFNRLDTTEKVFARIRHLKPKFLFVAADGWRNDAERLKCLEVRGIIEKIDWDCQVQTFFQSENLGCGKAVSSAISWFFSHVEQGIILEDDCLPDDTFFSFCETLLDYYKNDSRVMHISGNNFQLSKVSNDSYYFTNSCFIWGWATWRRAWLLYDFEMTKYNSEFIQETALLTTNEERRYWNKNFLSVKNKEIDTWDYQWFYCCWENSALSIMPQYNLVSNIGFREDATHTKANTIVANLKTFSISEIIHPSKVERNLVADAWHCQIMNLYNRDIKYYLDKLILKMWTK